MIKGKVLLKYISYIVFIIFILIPFIRLKLSSMNIRKNYKMLDITNDKNYTKKETITYFSFTNNTSNNKYTKEVSIMGQLLDKGQIKDFKEILKYSDAEYIDYDVDGYPEDFSTVLNQFPNLKTIDLDNDRSSRAIMLENSNAFKGLKVENLICTITSKGATTIFENMSTLKHIDCLLTFDEYDKQDILIKNKTLETLKIKHETYYKENNTAIFDTKNDFISPIILDTPNLKELSIQCYHFPGKEQDLNINFQNSEPCYLDSISIYMPNSVKFSDSKNKLKVKTLILERVDYEDFSLQQTLDGIDLNSLEALEIASTSASKLEGIELISKLKNLKCLNLYNIRVTDISWIEQLQNLEELYINKNIINDLSPLGKLTNLKQTAQ